MASNLAERISIQKLDKDRSSSKYPPQRMGDEAPTAYGGYTIAYGIHSACQEVPQGFHLYSVLGNYLRAANTDEKVICKMTELRRSKSFLTYRVTIEQKQPGGEVRPCMELLADFHKEEQTLLSYCASPTREYSHWRDCVPWEQVVMQWYESGKITQTQCENMRPAFRTSTTMYECRPCPEGVAYHNLMGVFKAITTNQEELPPTGKSSADWVRVEDPLRTEGEQMASLGFVMDGMLSLLPLIHNHLFYDDVSACSSLDFALRIFSPRLNVNNWHLREAIGHHAGHGRSYSESRIWDEKGNLVACMTQQSILRAPTETAKI
ncbi:hypothetical protein Plec18167_009551 [Paecilomyces lecythidis]|uniref:Uncharacterized protein n=1 Tax=Paecilomyces lecythidis TaxID=3004212 RepID=A0ABR3WN69_9EURO